MQQGLLRCANHSQLPEVEVEKGLRAVCIHYHVHNAFCIMQNEKEFNLQS